MDELGPLERERLMARYGRMFSAGDALFREGDLGTEAFLLQEGRVRLIKRIALSDGAALALDQGTFQHLLEMYPAVAGRLVQQLVRRLRDAEDQIELMMLRDAQSKIVAALIKAAQQAPPGQVTANGPLLVAVSPMELSTRVGLDVDAVKRGVQRLREGHYVRVVDEQLEILDLDALRRLYGLLGMKDQIRGGSAEEEAPAP
jgi:CRP/FNR family cyclic AMP-dependent transcriptional regulator